MKYMRGAIVIFILVALTTYGFAGDVVIRDRSISGNKAQVTRVGSDYALRTNSLEKGLQVQIDYDGGASIVYVGWAAPDAKTSDTTGWRIIKLVYSGTDVVEVQYANQVNTFTLEYDNRATYDYTP